METYLTKKFLKKKLGEFDLEGVTYVELSNNDIQTIQGLQECVNVEVLNLRNNQLILLDLVVPFEHLKVLDLSCNKIINLEGLEKCTNLENINAAGNNITSSSSVRNLSKLRKLKRVRFTDTIGDLTNPFCLSADYPSVILDILANIRYLDGEPVVSRSSEVWKKLTILENRATAIGSNFNQTEEPIQQIVESKTTNTIIHKANQRTSEIFKDIQDNLLEVNILEKNIRRKFENNSIPVLCYK